MKLDTSRKFVKQMPAQTLFITHDCTFIKLIHILFSVHKNVTHVIAIKLSVNQQLCLAMLNLIKLENQMMISIIVRAWPKSLSFFSVFRTPVKGGSWMSFKFIDTLHFRKILQGNKIKSTSAKISSFC